MSRDPAPGGRGAGEAASISVLTIGLAALVVAAILVGVAASAVQIQDRRLLACADRVAQAAAGALSADAYYGAGGAPRTLRVDEGGARRAARSALVELGSTTCAVGQGVRIEAVRAGGDGVEVDLLARSRLPLLPGVASGLPAPTLRASGSARIG